MANLSPDQMPHKELKDVMEDNALTRVPDEEKQGWPTISWNLIGCITTLVQLLLGATCTFIGGIWVGLMAGITAVVVGGLFGTLIGNIACKQGLSNTLLSRYHGFGTKGSIMPSVIFNTFMIGMLALENVLIYEVIMFFFKIPETTTNAVITYLILTVIWIALSSFGIKLVTKVSSISVVGFLAVLCYMMFNYAMTSGTPMSEILTHGAVFPGGTPFGHYVSCINIMLGTAGAYALGVADFGRYAKSTKDVAIGAFAGMFVLDIIIFLAGSIFMLIGFPIVTNYYVAQGMTAEAAGAAAMSNVGATFIILGGAIGLILALLAQAKVQVLNSYLSSLALTNMGDAVGFRPGRFGMIIIANIIGLLMIWGDILGLINSWIMLIGVLTSCQCVIMATDYYIIRKGQDVSEIQPPDYNWAGITTVIVATVVAYLMANIIPVMVITSVVLSFVLYYVLRKNVFKEKVVTVN